MWYRIIYDYSVPAPDRVQGDKVDQLQSPPRMLDLSHIDVFPNTRFIMRMGDLSHIAVPKTRFSHVTTSMLL